MMDSRPLRHLLAVATYPTVQAAADALHLTQPALTKSIARFEDAIGEKLFDRRGRTLELTELGRRLVNRADLLVRQLSEVEEEIRLWKGIGTGEVDIGADPGAELSLLPAVLSRFAANFAGVEVRVRSGHVQTLLPRLRAGEVHFVIADPELAMNDNQLSVTSLATSELVAAVRTDHPLTNAAQLTLEEVLSCPFVGGSSAPRFERWRTERGEDVRGMAFKPWVHCDNFEVLVRLAERTDAIVFIPENVVLGYQAAGRLTTLPLPVNSPPVEISLIRSRGRPLSPAAEKLAELFVATALETQRP